MHSKAKKLFFNFSRRWTEIAVIDILERVTFSSDSNSSSLYYVLSPKARRRRRKMKVQFPRRNFPREAVITIVLTLILLSMMYSFGGSGKVVIPLEQMMEQRKINKWKACTSTKNSRNSNLIDIISFLSFFKARNNAGIIGYRDFPFASQWS